MRKYYKTANYAYPLKALTFLSVRLPLDFNQICLDITLEHDKVDVLDSIFKITVGHKLPKFKPMLACVSYPRTVGQMVALVLMVEDLRSVFSINF